MPDLSAWVAAYGLWGLALAAFLAATLLPLSSEVAVIAALRLGSLPLTSYYGPPWQLPRAL